MISIISSISLTICNQHVYFAYAFHDEKTTYLEDLYNISRQPAPLHQSPQAHRDINDMDEHFHRFHL